MQKQCISTRKSSALLLWEVSAKYPTTHALLQVRLAIHHQCAQLPVEDMQLQELRSKLAAAGA
jgi:hypothetical protein